VEFITGTLAQSKVTDLKEESGNFSTYKPGQADPISFLSVSEPEDALIKIQFRACNDDGSNACANNIKSVI
jgi:hypothetical protein